MMDTTGREEATMRDAEGSAGRHHGTRGHVPHRQHQGECEPPKLCVVLTFLSLDADAGFCCLAGSSIHGYWKCFYTNIICGGHASTMARRVVGNTWRGTCSCSTFWHIRSYEGTCGRKQRWKPVASDVCVSRPSHPFDFLASKLPTFVSPLFHRRSLTFL